MWSMQSRKINKLFTQKFKLKEKLYRNLQKYTFSLKKIKGRRNQTKKKEKISKLVSQIRRKPAYFFATIKENMENKRRKCKYYQIDIRVTLIILKIGKTLAGKRQVKKRKRIILT